MPPVSLIVAVALSESAGRQGHVGVLAHDVITFIGLMAITLAVPMIVRIASEAVAGCHRMRCSGC